MKAVVMAGGEGTRLRPLTSNRPKPMVPVINRPVMEHIVELLRLHGFPEIVATLQFLPQSIKSYFGDGSDLGVSIRSVVEETPLGTAGSVKNAAAFLDETFVVISGDALTDIDLTRVFEFHQERKALATITLTRVDNPLEFGVVVTDETGRIERFLEKPTWGQVFSDTINTGIYVLEPDIFDFIPEGKSFDFSQDLFPLLLEKGLPLYGYAAEGYWCDIGNLEQYLHAHQDVLEGRVKVVPEGVQMSGDIYVGNGVLIDPSAKLYGPLVIGENSRIEADAEIRPFSVIGDNVVVGQGAYVDRSVVLDNCYIGPQAQLRAAIVGESCDIKRGARLEEWVSVGDECVIGESAIVNHHIKIYPFKTVDAGATVTSNVIWESRVADVLFGKGAISGLANIEITPERAVRIGMAMGSALPKKAHVVGSRDASRAARVIKRALITGLNATGVHCRDLEIAVPALNRFTVRTTRSLGGLHVRSDPEDAQAVQIQIFDAAGIDIDEGAQRGIEKHFHRGEFRRAFFDEIGEILYPPRTTEFYVAEILRIVDTERIADRKFKMVVDYGFGSSSLIMPSLMGHLGVSLIALNPYTSPDRALLTSEEYEQSFDQLTSAVEAFNADFAVLMDTGGERLFLVDERGRRIPTHTALLLLIELVCRTSPKKGQVAVPLNVSNAAEELAARWGCQLTRTKASSSSLMFAALAPNVIFAGSPDGAYIFPRFMPAYDATMGLCKLLELLASVDEPLSGLVDKLPSYHIATREVFCPWDHKGLVMRKVTEESKGEELVLLDGVKVVSNGLWTLVLPDPEEPVVYICAEGPTDKDAEAAVQRFAALVDEIVKGSAPAGLAASEKS